jgi:chromosome segregation ATPase
MKPPGAIIRGKLSAAITEEGIGANKPEGKKDKDQMKEKLLKILALINKTSEDAPLTDQLKDAIKDFDVQKAIDTLQAEARRKAEKDTATAKASLEELQTKYDELKAEKESSKTDMQKLADQVKDLQGKFTAAEKEAKQLKADNAKAERASTLRKIADTHGIVFADGLNKTLLQRGFEEQFDALSDEDLANEETVSKVVESFRAANPAALKAPDAPGGNTPPGNPRLPHSGPNPYAKETENLTRQLEIEASNPTLAKSLQAAAGVEINS